MRATGSGVTHRGFTLIEIMIVVSIISILAAILVPSTLEARRLANEGDARQTLRAIFAAQQQFHNKTGVYAAALPQLVLAGFLGEKFKATGGAVQRSGAWEFSTRIGPGGNNDAGSKFRIMAQPTGKNTTERLKHGDQIYFMLESGQMFSHRNRLSACALNHGDGAIQTYPDNQFGTGINLPTDGQ